MQKYQTLHGGRSLLERRVRNVMQGSTAVAIATTTNQGFPTTVQFLAQNSFLTALLTTFVKSSH